MNSLPLFLFMVSLAPIRNARDYDFRWLLAEAIADAAPGDVQQQRTLARIAWLESAFRRAVARCEIKGDAGKSLGVFQVKPIDRGDDRRACGDLPDQARLAKRYVDRSAEACPGNVGADRLNVYTSGRCNAGHTASVRRWEPETDAISASGWTKTPNLQTSSGQESTREVRQNVGLGKPETIPLDTALSGIE